jgi:hypothetical protein
MPLVSVPYRFSVRLPASCEAAYRWSTDYRPDDLALSGRRGTRKVVWLTPDALLLTDTIPKGRGTDVKTRLVRLYPDRCTWTNTHVSGASLHSQFLYELEPEGRNASRLEFTGLQLLRLARRPSPSAIATLGRAIAREDAALWRTLARAMARDLSRGRIRRPSRTVPVRSRRSRRSSR